MQQKIEFNFKKSVFFYDSVIVCLGSDILVRNSGRKRAQTTLFQDKHTSKISSIYVNGKTKWLSKDYSRLLTDSAAILDTNGNGYYVPKNSSAKVTIALQTSRTNDGKHVSKARYATVWLDHGINPFSASYEYAIIVASDVEDIEAFRKDQTSDSPRYEVLHKNSAAHVVRFPGAGDRNNPSITYGYAFFKESAELSEGPIQSVTAQCIIMADIDMPDFSQINVSISSPDLNYNTTKVLNTSADNGINEYFYMRSQPVNISVYVTKSVALQKVLINGKAVAKSRNGHYAVVKPQDLEDQTVKGSVIDFINLINGESVEVFLTISDVIV